MVSEKKIFLCFSYYKSMGANDPRDVANLDPMDMIGRIYSGYHQTLLHTKYTGFRSCGFREDFSHLKPMADNDAPIFSCYSHYKPFADNDASWAWPIWTTGTWLAGFMKGITKNCYT